MYGKEAHGSFAESCLGNKPLDRDTTTDHVQRMGKTIKYYKLKFDSILSFHARRRLYNRDNKNIVMMQALT